MEWRGSTCTSVVLKYRFSISFSSISKCSTCTSVVLKCEWVSWGNSRAGALHVQVLYWNEEMTSSIGTKVVRSTCTSVVLK